MKRGWDIAVVFVLLALIGSAALVERLMGLPLIILVSAIVGIGVLYFTQLRTFAHVDFKNSPTNVSKLHANLVIILLVVLSCVLIWVHPAMMFIQVLIFSYVWMGSRDRPQAIWLSVFAGVAVFLAFAGGRGWTKEFLLVGFGSELVSVTFAIALGTWIDRIARWGEERDALLCELRETQGELDAAHRDAGAQIERERIAREIHDGIAQGLSSIVMLAQKAGREPRPDLTIALIEDTAAEALGEARALVVANASVNGAFTDSSLNAGLERLGERFTRETGITVHVDARAKMQGKATEVVLLRCVQEALANVRKHSGASSVRVELSSDAESITLVVKDNGRGLCGYELDNDSGFGLSGMMQRVAELEGSMSVSDDPPSGVRVHVRLPATPPSSTGASAPVVRSEANS